MILAVSDSYNELHHHNFEALDGLTWLEEGGVELQGQSRPRYDAIAVLFWRL